MNTTSKVIISALVAVILLMGVYIFTHQSKTVILGGVGDTQSSAQIASIIINDGTSTLASFFNGSGRDRIISDVFFYATSTAVTQTYRAATSTIPYVFFGDTTIFPLYENTISTSTIPVYLSTTTIPQGLQSERIWSTGSYLNLSGSASNDTGLSGGIFGVKFWVR